MSNIFIRKIKKRFSYKEIILAVLTVSMSIFLGFFAFNLVKKDVDVNDNGTLISLKTMKSTAGEVLKQAGIEVEKEDYINLSLETKLSSEQKNDIYIKRAVPINLYIDGKELEVKTYKDNIKEAIENLGITLTEKDKLAGNNFEDKIVKDMNIKVVRVTEKLVNEEEAIPFEVVREPNRQMDEGSEKVVEEGEEGVKQKTYKVVLEDGKEVLKELVNEIIISNPINKIVQYGTILNHQTSRGDTLRYKKVMDMRATAYTASFKDTGKNPGDPGFGITYTGVKAKRGIIAVDPKVIPLWTKVYVEVAGNIPDYGYAVACDIGSAIKGDLIDLYLDDQVTVDKWGCKKVKVYILEDQ